MIRTATDNGQRMTDNGTIGMTREELEFSIGQYLDGTLDEDGRVALEARLAADAEVREIVREERALTAVLHGALPVPAVRWDALADRISGAIDEQLQERVERASWAMRFRSPGFLALAASVVLAAAISLKLMTGHRSSTGPAQVPPAPAAVAMVIEGPREDQPAGKVVEEISIGPGGSYAKAPSLAPYAEEIDTRPARVVIAAGVSLEDAPPASPF